MSEKIKVTLTNARPARLSTDRWPLIAKASTHDNQYEFQANNVWVIKVREHSDGRRIVYGWHDSGNGGCWAGFRATYGGFRIPSLAGGPDHVATIAAIRKIGELIGDESLAAECIADLPAEDLDGSGDAPAEKLAQLLALLAQAERHVPSGLAGDIRAILAG